MKSFLISFLLFIIAVPFFAQGVKIGETGGNPDASSILDLESSSKGFLAPRMSQAERDLIVSPAEGLILYNTTTGCINYRSGASWLLLCGVCEIQPTASVAGPDQLYVNGSSVTLAANTPVVGTGAWSVVSGSGGSFAAASSPTSSFTGVPGNSYVLRWTISTSCANSQDDLSVSFLPLNSCGIVTDIDNNVYYTVQIGSQCWMKQNLNVTRNAGGTSITRHCFDNNPANCATYGGLYTWNTMMNGQSSSNTNPGNVQGICPTGWHIPSDAEFCTMENTVEPGTDAGCSNFFLRGVSTGTKLKLGGTSGFDALPTGAFWIDSFAGIGEYGYFWTSRQTDATTAFVRYHLEVEPQFGRYSGNGKEAGYGVRCVKN